MTVVTYLKEEATFTSSEKSFGSVMCWRGGTNMGGRVGREATWAN